MKTINTRKFFICIGFVLVCAIASATNGLEKIIVEKYYVSNSYDADNSVGTLPVGSVTYRVFADLLPGYQFMMAYGDRNHELFFKTTTSFFNNEDRGSTTPTYTKTQAKNNTVMLDSWLTAGAACVGNFGILKKDDDGVANVINADDILQGADASAGIPLTEQDGLIAGSPKKCDLIGIDTIVSVFDATSQVGSLFKSSNGAWSCLNGAVGPTTDNRVLIAQITTDGELSFELNIQLRYFQDGNPIRELYVARNPQITDGIQEIQDSGLIFNSNNITAIKTVFGEVVKPEILVFPNPSAGLFSYKINPVNSNSEVHLNIYNLLGKAILKKEMGNASGNYSGSIDLSSFANGLYFMEVSINGVKTPYKLIKK